MIVGASPALTRAELVGLALLWAFAGPVVFLYFAAAAGFGVTSAAAAAITAVGATALGIGGWSAADPQRDRGDLAVLLGTITVTIGYLLWLGWPSLLPPGSGPDLTHHLLLVDYIERLGSPLTDDVARLGEMASYTPGVHLLAVASGSLLGVPGFFTIYAVVVSSVALKFGIFSLVLLRLGSTERARIPLAAAGTAWLFLLPAFTIDSFAHDSFLAQVVAELFGVAMFWAVVAWAQRPSAWPAAVFGVAGMATFLTWPVWTGPMLAALPLVMLLQRATPRAARWRHFAVAVGPVLLVAAFHTVSRTAALPILATSGAVPQPSLAAIGWTLPLLAAPGLVLATSTAAGRAACAVALGLAAQAGALWLLARHSGAATPYMALKMGYLAVYPSIALAVIALGHLPRPRAWAWLAALFAIGGAVAHATTTHYTAPTVSADLWRAGTWARSNLPADNVDYLVRDEYTAYWLHLAVLGNSRSASRSMDDDTYLTEPSFARWIIDADAPRYAIGKFSALPREIRDRSRVIQQFGDAVVIERMPPDPAR